jgi:hypothetical protein
MDPWLKEPADDAAMDNAIFVGHYDLPIEGVFIITEALFLSGGPRFWWMWAIHIESDLVLERILHLQAAHDPGWRELGGTRGLALTGIANGSPEEAATYLLYALQRAHYPYTSAIEPYRGGLLSVEAIGAVISDLHAEWDRNRLEAIAEAERKATPIVFTARELHLNPRPSGRNANDWYADCPSGRGHSIMIGASSNQFGCGYCHWKGGPEELLRFHQAFQKKGPNGTRFRVVATGPGESQADSGRPPLELLTFRTFGWAFPGTPAGSGRHGQPSPPR